MSAGDRALRILVVMPSWVGDAVMSTPALRALRDARAGCFIGALCRPGVGALMQGSDLFDEIHTYIPHGMMAPKKAASKVRPRRYGSSILMTNSFSTALITRLAFIDRRIGYDRDGRGVLLTDRVRAPKNPDGSWKIAPAVDYYWNLVAHALGEDPIDWSVHTPSDCVSVPLALPSGARMELGVTDEEESIAREVLSRAGVRGVYAVVNPGGNNPKKRWPIDRYSALIDHLSERGLSVLVNGSPDERDLVSSIIDESGSGAHALPELGSTLGALKPIVRDARIMVTNDTGPRHIAAAFSTPLVSIFGPTDPRWTTIPVDRFDDGTPKEVVLVADPDLPPNESANDHPDRCAVENVSMDRVVDAVSLMLGANG